MTIRGWALRDELVPKAMQLLLEWAEIITLGLSEWETKMALKLLQKMAANAVGNWPEKDKF
ncbi:MAG TPA: hypothetical protein VFC58_01060 [Desulfosporosinus sp.]|nr:hypothetical protein [Desulfosporosinus sp.]